MEYLVGMIILLFALLALGWWQTAQAKAQVSIITQMPIALAAQVVQDSFGRLGWSQVSGRGDLNFKARVPMNGPILSVSFEEQDGVDGCEVSVWMSEWTSRYGIANGAPVASRQRKKILKAFDAVPISE